MKKKKNSNSRINFHKLTKWILKSLLVIVVMPTLVGICNLTLYLGSSIQDSMSARSHLSAMQYWELPPNSEFVAFSIDDMAASSCVLFGNLKIKSDLTSKQLTEFYQSRYGSKYRDFGEPIAARAIKENVDHKKLFAISAVESWSCH